MIKWLWQYPKLKLMYQLNIIHLEHIVLLLMEEDIKVPLDMNLNLFNYMYNRNNKNK